MQPGLYGGAPLAVGARLTLVSVVAAALGGSGAFARGAGEPPLELSLTPYLWATA